MGMSFKNLRCIVEFFRFRQVLPDEPKGKSLGSLQTSWDKKRKMSGTPRNWTPAFARHLTRREGVLRDGALSEACDTRANHLLSPITLPVCPVSTLYFGVLDWGLRDVHPCFLWRVDGKPPLTTKPPVEHCFF